MRVEVFLASSIVVAVFFLLLLSLAKKHRNFLTFMPSISSRIFFCCSRNESRTMSEPAGAEAPP